MLAASQLAQQGNQAWSAVNQQSERAARRRPLDGFLQRSERGDLVPLRGEHQRLQSADLDQPAI